jgi:hypothetical protein
LLKSGQPSPRWHGLKEEENSRCFPPCEMTVITASGRRHNAGFGLEKVTRRV